MNNYKNNQINFDIDYSFFTTDEIVKIINFFDIIIKYNEKEFNDKMVIINKYHEYQKILNSKALEKKYNKMLYDQTDINIYQIMKELENKK